LAGASTTPVGAASLLERHPARTGGNLRGRAQAQLRPAWAPARYKPSKSIDSGANTDENPDQALWVGLDLSLAEHANLGLRVCVTHACVRGF
jgi:hypothetical protein